ncbi:MAG: pitrilysin family protein [Candidatus Shapirobacteria bacterium]|nr:pitrilysin family protein [Candidatus Shapirobacteria bacterium]
MFFEEFNLSGGLKVLLLPDHSESVTVLGLVRVGSRYEDESREGLAHFYEHMVFKGTKKFPSKQDLALAVDEIGAEYNGATAQEYTYYYTKTAGRDFSVGLDLISQLLLEPLLAKKEISVERGVILEELYMYHDVPQYRAQIELARLLFPNHPLGASGVGRKETITNFTQKDFVDFKETFYWSGGIVLVVAGGIKNLSRIKKEINAYFSSPPRGETISFCPFRVKSEREKIKKVNKETDQVHLAMGVRALSRQDKRRFAQGLLNIILGGGMSSRLFQEIREKRGLCYSINSSTELFNEVGFFEITAGLNKERLAEAIREIKNQLFLLAEKRVKREELDKAKHFFEGKLFLSLEDSYKKAHFYGKQLLLEPDVKSADQVLKIIKSVDESDILSVAKEIFSPEKIKIALVGSLKGGDT